MKNIGKILALASVVFLSSCGEKGINIYENDPTAALTKKVNEQLKPEMNIVELQLDQESNKAPFTDNMGTAYVTIVGSDNVTKTMVISLVDGKVTEEEESKLSAGANKPSEEGVFTRNEYGSVADLNYGQIKTNLEKAGKMVTEEKFENAGTHQYEILLNKDKSKIVHRFTLNAKSKNATKLQGKRLMTDYFQIDFEADNSGNVKMLGEEK